MYAYRGGRLHDDAAAPRARVADDVAGVAGEARHAGGAGRQAERVQLHRHVRLRHLRQRVHAVVVRRRQAALHRAAVCSNLRSLLLQICESSCVNHDGDMNIDFTIIVCGVGRGAAFSDRDLVGVHYQFFPTVYRVLVFDNLIVLSLGRLADTVG